MGNGSATKNDDEDDVSDASRGTSPVVCCGSFSSSEVTFTPSLPCPSSRQSDTDKDESRGVVACVIGA